MTARTLLAAGALLLAVSTAAGRADERPAPPFDYYLLSLSWSPAYCAQGGAADRSAQCTAGSAPRGFVLHGLWPERNDGGYPANCPTGERVSEDTVRRTLPAMPDRGLIRHEWRRHGACSGLAPDAYFDRAVRAYARIVVPPPLRRPEPGQAASVGAVRAWFVAANPGLPPDGLALRCEADRRTLAEVRVCLGRDLSFRSCGYGVADTCGPEGVRFVPGR